MNHVIKFLKLSQASVKGIIRSVPLAFRIITTYQLCPLETASGDIGLYVNAKKTEYMSYNQIGTMHTLSGDDIKSVSFHLPWQQCRIHRS